MDDSPTKVEDGVVDRRSSGYKSWKKKYRKMRIVFDQKMQQGEELHRQEDKASATVKRLAVENDRLLDLLLEINNSPQIPPEKRIDLSLEPSANPKVPVLPLDRQRTLRKKEQTLKGLEQLLGDVPHSSYGAAKDAHPPYMADLAASDGEAHPASFLSADDIDNYMHAIDLAMDPDSAEAHMPTLAPGVHPVPHPHLKNPTSVTNWLRKHAPKIFLQDAEHHAAATEHADDADGGHHHHHNHHHHHHAGGRKSRGGRAERGGKASARGKRASAASRLVAAERAGDADASMDDDADFASTPVAARGKRKRDEDPGYRPGGSTTRPAKKKRKSEGDGTPSVRKSKKDASAAASKED